MTDSRLFLDSNVWIEYFFGTNPEVKKLIEESDADFFTSVLSLHEIFKRAQKLTDRPSECIKALQIIEDHSQIAEVNKKIALEAVQYCTQNGLHTIDALLYASALQANAVFVTADRDFSGIPNTRLITPFKIH